MHESKVALPNDKMKADRFRRWAVARRRVRWIQDHLKAGHTVQVANGGFVLRLSRRHIDMVKAFRDGVHFQQGKRWVSVEGSHYSAFE